MRPMTLPLRRFKSLNNLASSCSLYNAFMATSVLMISSLIESLFKQSSCRYLVSRGFSLTVSSKLLFKLFRDVLIAFIEGIGVSNLL